MRKLLFTCLLCSLVLSGFTQDYDLIIRNGRIIDGTGNSWYRSDIGIRNGQIVRIGNLQQLKGSREIDAKGMIVAPGFIDVHGHIESGIFARPTADNYLFDGVTTVVTGNCGGSESDIPLFFHRIDSAGRS